MASIKLSMRREPSVTKEASIPGHYYGWPLTAAPQTFRARRPRGEWHTIIPEFKESVYRALTDGWGREEAKPEEDLVVGEDDNEYRIWFHTQDTRGYAEYRRQGDTFTLQPEEGYETPSRGQISLKRMGVDPESINSYEDYKQALNELEAAPHRQDPPA